MKRLKSSDINLIGELANQHPDLAERLKVIRSHLAYTYGQQCAKDICTANLEKQVALDSLQKPVVPGWPEGMTYGALDDVRSGRGLPPLE